MRLAEASVRFGLREKESRRCVEIVGLKTYSLSLRSRGADHKRVE